MATAIPTLWSDDIAVDILTPLAILRVQASGLSPLTKGILESEVVTTESPSQTSHRLQLIAPVLDGYRRTIFTATHGRGQPYPVILEADCFRADADHPDFDPEDDWRPTAWTFQELLGYVKQALQSKEVRAELQSLIARSNEPVELRST